MSKRLTGLNPLAYMGVEPEMPPNMYMSPNAPTPTDVQNFNLGDFWVDTTTQELWVLVSQKKGVATWITLFGGASDVFVTDAGTAIPAAGIINLNGDSLNINTTGAGNTVHVNLNPNLTLTGLTLTGFTGGVLVSNGAGVISEVTTTNHSLLIGNSSGTISSLGVATNGQIPIGSTGADPVLNTITAGSGISVTPGAGTITIAATGGTGTVTSITAGTGITLTPSPITTTGSVALTVPVVVANGGTGDTSLTAYAVLCGGTTSTNPVQSIASVGTAGQILTSNGAGALPTFQTNSNTVLSTTINLTNTQIKNLKATPIQIIAAQGANTLIVPLDAIAFLDYGGTNAFVEPATRGTINLFFTSTNTGANTTGNLMAQGSYTQTTSNYQQIGNPASNGGVPTASCINQPVYVALDQTASAEITGNAANDNTISIRLEYFVLTVPL